MTAIVRLLRAFVGQPRRWLVAASLFAYVADCLGYLVPEPLVSKAGEAFACQYHRCGCSSAAECWSNCCCFSRDERLAWCRTNGVAPPALLSNAAETSARGSAAASSCCTAAKSCCTRKASQGCEHAKRCGEPQTRQPPVESDGFRFVLGIQSRKCRGLDRMWGVGPVSLPPPTPVRWTYEWIASGRVLVFCSWAESPIRRPAVPPPRASSLRVRPVW